MNMRNALLIAVFFLICFGLGYPTLNRYDPRASGGLGDTIVYYDLAVHGPRASLDPQLKFRLLIPLLSRPVTRLAAGHIGTWEPVFFGFLVVNSLFTALTAWLLVVVARRFTASEPAALLAAALYLLNFETSNIRVSGMVDSGEGLALMAIVWSLLTGRLWLLPVWGLLGTASKETFVPLCMVFSAGWWFFDRRAMVLSAGVAALVGIAVLQSLVLGHWMWPWEFAAALGPQGNHWRALRENVLDQNLLYCIVWLLPLGLPRLRRLPLAWVAASLAAVLVDFALVTWHISSAGAAARPFFSFAGPLLSLSAAMYLSERDLAA